MCDLSTRIIERNENASTHAYATTQEIDEGLDRIAKEMPTSWWAIPDIVVNDRTSEAALTFDRLMIQVWFFQRTFQLPQTSKFSSCSSKSQSQEARLSQCNLNYID